MASPQVRANTGADHMTSEAFERQEADLLMLMYNKLKIGTCLFKHARRKLIPAMS
jgi:hypothetical protein